MSKREADKRKAIDALARIAYSAGSAPPPPAPKGRAPPPPAPPKPKAAPTPRRAPDAADLARAKQLAQRREKLAEERALRERRANELARNARIDRSRIDPFGVPTSIRRTGFDRVEPSTSQKIQDVLGDARAKEGREKARAKGRRQGGR